jgi:hypothetical protein
MEFLNSAQTMVQGSPTYTSGLMIGVVILMIVIGVSLLMNVWTKSGETSTPDNISRIKDKQIIDLTNRWTGITAGKKGLQEAVSNIPTDQQLLINTSVFATRLTGYLGPFSAGVFDGDAATRFALASGARCLVLEIGRYENGLEPKLLYRDQFGVKLSLNDGSIQSVAKSIAGRAFNATNEGAPSSVADDPLFLVLYVTSAPDQATQPREYIRFLGSIARELQPIRDMIVGMTPQGDFRGQKLEGELFFKHRSVFSRKIITLCNADTSGFRRLDALGLKGEISDAQNLDTLVNVRLVSPTSQSGFGVTSTTTGNTSPAAYITSPDYWLNTPPDRLADTQSRTKRIWTLCMTPVSTPTDTINSEQLKKLLQIYGVHAIPITLFDNPSRTDIFSGRGAPYNQTAWIVKPNLIRYIPPKPIAIQKPSPKTNSGGGFIQTPKF